MHDYFKGMLKLLEIKLLNPSPYWSTRFRYFAVSLTPVPTMGSQGGDFQWDQFHNVCQLLSIICLLMINSGTEVWSHTVLVYSIFISNVLWVTILNSFISYFSLCSVLLLLKILLYFFFASLWLCVSNYSASINYLSVLMIIVVQCPL